MERCWQQNTGETTADMFHKAGINFQPANNDRLAGKAAWHDMLSPHKDGKPKLQDILVLY